jgi:hypothetical protein
MLTLMSHRTALVVVVSVLFLVISSAAQDSSIPDPEVVHPNIRVTVPNLLAAKSRDETSGAVAKAAMVTVLSASSVNCDRASQINAVLEANGGAPLQTLAEKLAGTSCMTNGTTTHLSAQFTPSGSIQADGIIAPLLRGKPLLIRWNGMLFVLHGVVYDEHLHNSGKRENVIRQLLLIDPRHSDERRYISFDRQRDDLSQVEGIAEIRFVP